MRYFFVLILCFAIANGQTILSNDDCDVPRMISLNQTITFDNTFATHESEGTYQECDFLFYQDLWFCFEAPDAGEFRYLNDDGEYSVIFSTCEGDFDSKISAYKVNECDCFNTRMEDPAICVDNDDCDLNEMASLVIIPGSKYMVRVGGYDEDAYGPGQLQLMESEYFDIKNSGLFALIILIVFTLPAIAQMCVFIYMGASWGFRRARRSMRKIEKKFIPTPTPTPTPSQMNKFDWEEIEMTNNPTPDQHGNDFFSVPKESVENPSIIPSDTNNESYMGEPVLDEPPLNGTIEPPGSVYISLNTESAPQDPIDSLPTDPLPIDSLSIDSLPIDSLPIDSLPTDIPTIHDPHPASDSPSHPDPNPTEALPSPYLPEEYIEPPYSPVTPSLPPPPPKKSFWKELFANPLKQ